MNWRKASFAIVSVLLLVWAGWFFSWRGPLHWVRLRDGSKMQVVAVTYGKQHRASVGSRREQLARLVPTNIFPSWPRSLSFRTNTPRNTLVVWLCSSNWPAHFDSYGSGLVVGADGLELETCRVLGRARGNGQELLALAVEAFPRQEPTFTLRLRNVYQWIGNTRQVFPLAETVLKNPLRPRFTPWQAPPAPRTVTTPEFQCELVRCEVNPNQCIGTPLHLEWRFSEAGQPVDHWKVHHVELEDASGNFLRESWVDGPAVASGGPSAGALRRSLWPGAAGAWKVRAFVLRRENFPAHEIWEVRGIPLANDPSYGMHLWRTNLNGEWLEAGPEAAARHSRILPQVFGLPVGNRANEYWTIALFGSQDLQDRTQLLALQDDQGRPGTILESLRITQLRAWRREWEPDTRSLTLRLGASRWRVVEVIVEPTVTKTEVEDSR